MLDQIKWKSIFAKNPDMKGIPKYYSHLAIFPPLPQEPTPEQKAEVTTELLKRCQATLNGIKCNDLMGSYFLPEEYAFEGITPTGQFILVVHLYLKQSPFSATEVFHPQQDDIYNDLVRASSEAGFIPVINPEEHPELLTGGKNDPVLN